MNFHINDIENLQGLGDQDKPLTVWVPSEHLSCHRVAMPTAPKRKWQELLPWLLEERLLNEVSTLHFVIAGKLAEQELSVLVCSKASMQHWQDLLKQAGIKSCVMLPDYLALPWQKGLISIAQRDEFILVRYGELEGFAAEPELAWPLLERILAGADHDMGLALALAEDLIPDSLRERIKTRRSGINWGTA